MWVHTRNREGGQLPEDEVHVWKAGLTLPDAFLADLSCYLSGEERARAARFVSEEQRARFIVARSVLRQLLGGYLGADPADLRFAYGAYGKPELAGEHGSSGLCFNLSHSASLALYAVARRRDVGIDVERLRPGVAIEQIARRFFAPAEIDSLLSLPEEQRQEGFYNCWTRKEAYLKARGKGITTELQSFAVSLRPGEAACLLACGDGPEAGERWHLRSLHPERGYAAALCVEGSGWKLRCWQWR